LERQTPNENLVQTQRVLVQHADEKMEETKKQIGIIMLEKDKQILELGKIGIKQIHKENCIEILSGNDIIVVHWN
jgi:hypothetical protein